MALQQNVGDQDAGKGAVEGDGRGRKGAEQNGNTSMSGQNPHRTESRLVKSNDTDFPEPGGSPEHSGQQSAEEEHPRPQSTGRQGGDTPPAEGSDIQSRRSPEREVVSQGPGERQRKNHSGEEDDPLAA